MTSAPGYTLSTPPSTPDPSRYSPWILNERSLFWCTIVHLGTDLALCKNRATYDTQETCHPRLTCTTYVGTNPAIAKTVPRRWYGSCISNHRATHAQTVPLTLAWFLHLQAPCQHPGTTFAPCKNRATYTGGGGRTFSDQVLHVGAGRAGVP